MKEERKVCVMCGEEIDSDFEEVDGEYLCLSCFEDNYFYCEDCESLESRDEGYWIDCECRMVCSSCINNYTRCEDCGEYVPDGCYYEINDGTGNYYYVCDSCYGSGCYYYCDNCGDYFHEDYCHFENDYCYCDNCYEEQNHNRLYDYHEFNSWQLFKGKNEENAPYYIGKEIELEPKNGANEDGVLDAIEKHINAVGMHDGSLKYGGVEVVTHPESWEYLQENKQKYIDFFNEMEKLDYGNNGGCGLHFHVTRPNDDVVARVIVIMESFRNEIFKLSRRSQNQMHWCQFLTSDSNIEKENIKYQSTKYLKDKYFKRYHERYYALNLCNSKTIEFRFFNGVSNFEEYWGALQFIHNIMELALDETKELNTINWQDLLVGDELREQARKRSVLDINKYAKDTTEIMEKYEIALEKAKKDIKNILKNLAKYVNNEMSNLDLKTIKAANVKDMNTKVDDFIRDFQYRRNYLNRIIDLYNALENNSSLEMVNIKDYVNNTNASFPVNAKRYQRYGKQIEKAIKDYESEVR